MTPEEYQAKLDDLKKQELKLAQEFIKDNPFKGLEGKYVNLTIGCSRKRVMFARTDMLKDDFNRPSEPALFYHKLNKDGNPRKNSDNIPVRFYDGKTYKIEKI